MSDATESGSLGPDHGDGHPVKGAADPPAAGAVDDNGSHVAHERETFGDLAPAHGRGAAGRPVSTWALAKKQQPSGLRPRHRVEPAPQDAALDDILQQVSPAIETYSGRQRLLMDVSKALQAAFPTCSVHTYGSTFTGLDLDGSDIDMCVLFPFIPDPRCLLDAALPVLEAAHVGQVYPIREARIPIIKIVDHHGYEADLCFNETSGLRNTQRTQKIMMRMPMLKKLARLIKWWAACRMLPDSRQGGIGSYAWVILALFCLTQTHSRSSMSIYEVLTNFFCMYTSRPPRSVASFEQKRWISKTAKGWLREDHPDALSIEDPNNPAVDLAWGISEYTDICLRAEFQRAFSILSGPAKADAAAVYSVFTPPPVPFDPWRPDAEAPDDLADGLPDGPASDAEPAPPAPRLAIAAAPAPDPATAPAADGQPREAEAPAAAAEPEGEHGGPAPADSSAAEGGEGPAGVALSGVEDATEGAEGDESEAGGPHDWASSSGSDAGLGPAPAAPPAPGASPRPAPCKKGKARKGAEAAAAEASLGPPVATSSSSQAASAESSSSSSSSPQLRPVRPAGHAGAKPRGRSDPSSPVGGLSPRLSGRTPRGSPRGPGAPPLGRGRGRERTRSRGASGAEGVAPEIAVLTLQESRLRKEPRRDALEARRPLEAPSPRSDDPADPADPDA